MWIFGFAGKTEAVPILQEGKIAVVHNGIIENYLELMVAARKDAPLLIGYGQEGNYIAYDVTALLAHTRTVTYMADDEVAVITADDVQIFDRDRFLLEKEKQLIEWDVSAAEKADMHISC